MPQEGFLRRWSRLKAHGAPEAPPPARDPVPELPAVAQTAPHPPVAPRPVAEPPPPVPTLEDVARLDASSDFSAFVSQGVDKAVQRLAMKKLFSDPHFNLMDGLDIYIDDYTRPDPMSAAMLASLQHTRHLFSARVEEGRNGEADPAAAQQLTEHDEASPHDPGTPAPERLAGDAPDEEPPAGAPGLDFTPRGQPPGDNAPPGGRVPPPPPPQDA
jgi:hypothetical protein